MKQYKDYGGKGISICDEWRNDFKCFYDWSIDNGYKEKLCIDRRNNNGNYEPSNCRFVTYSKNNQNRRLLRSTNKSGYCGVSKKSFSYISSLFFKGEYLLNKSGFKTAINAAIYRDMFIVKNNLPHKLNLPEIFFNGSI
ncbi:MAG: hypothetical protein GQ540_03665 [Lutibacter sp.]|uniref:hypothetical protein n=1 Tax=Lutibacter sp. TaxID=1925666 RepID=UPI001A0CA585|nr:hypothetical protein [Lutibacter sp.]NOR27610.1 hypothetical protein [Lutibacter sp.]